MNPRTDRLRELQAWTALLVAGVASAMAVYGPIEEPAGYQDFADRSVLLGIPHAGDVLSNVGFALVAAWGALALWPRRTALAGSWPGYALFLLALAGAAIGSTVYHWAPDNQRLVWDRLAVALACAGLLAAVYADVSGNRRQATLWLLGGAAVLSVVWWRFTDLAGLGDLRPYLLLQGLPLVLVPLWQWRGCAPMAERRAFGLAILLYMVAKGLELFDHAIHAVAAPLSGHTLKHVCAALAAAVIVHALAKRVRQTPAKALSDAA